MRMARPFASDRSATTAAQVRHRRPAGRGEADKSGLTGASQEKSESMTEKEPENFGATSREPLPDQVDDGA